MRLACLALASFLPTPAAIAHAADAVTVASLTKQGYVVSAGWNTPIGPGLVLQKGDSVYMCFVAETPGSLDVKTNYCKPVN